ncbi:phage tail-collar fiber domain-containing protein [Pseudomonas aeruginosa]|uniref:phage tail-collar fiber domain-containing protein n=1 Tax=Pseudomonas aeruginosa TaxID=287 RepID=UPI000B41D8C9|nr:phage tail protein [Pseudomonas aeruginosa]OVY98714.1 hypothetical protein CDO42_03805 [Pseudomonas aeruginosa]RPO43654.1 hypothetical protein IPC1191_16885 [Pseudomonas aeruginosa]RPO54733.1 hypothetical protein IPC1190_14255 [Pseudomonas aeruginosa]
MARITTAGERLIAQKLGEKKILEISRVVLALVPGLDPSKPVDRDAAKPPANQIVYTANVTKAGYVNPNQIVYSLMMGSDVGDFDWNWMGLESAEGVLFAVAWVPVQQKRKNKPPLQIGNNVTRNILVMFDGAQELTALTIDASTWQHDFTVRLAGIDERERRSNRDIFGRATFFNAGLLLEKAATNYRLKAGLAYVEGIRVNATADVSVAAPALPSTAWLDVRLQRDQSDVVASWSIAWGAALQDFTDSAGAQHYLVPLADLAANGAVTDRRAVEPIAGDLVRYLAARVGTYPNLRAQATTKGDVGLGNLPNAISDDPTNNNGQVLATTKMVQAVRSILQSALDAIVSGATVVGKAARLATPRRISISGAATGSGTFDGSADTALAITLADSGVTAGTYPKVNVNGKGLVTGGAALTAADLPALDVGKITTGVLPLARGGTGNTIGQAATAVKLASPRTLAIAGDASGSAAFDGSTNASITVTLANTGVADGTYTKVRVNPKGLVIGATTLTTADIPSLDASKVTSGMFADARLPWYAQGLCTSAPNTTDPNTTNIPLILTNHENGPIPGTFFYIQTMMYNQRNGNAAQIAVRYAANAEMYVRYMYDVGNKRGVWSAWKRCDVGGSFAKEADGELGGGVNLDTMIASGWWHQPFSANAKNGTNYPVGEAGLLTVHAPTSTMIYQTYRGYAAGGLYWRCRYNGTWSAWYRAWDSGNFNPANYVAKSEYSWASLPGKPATFPPSGHNHDATQITSGILPLARGGLGANNAVTARSNIGAGTIATASLGSSGWWRDNDTGLIRQWGRVTVGGDTTAGITFPIPFPNVCLGGFAGQTANFHPGTDASTSFYNLTTTGATVENGYQLQMVLFWEAFGR